jgi:hypothetical protein
MQQCAVSRVACITPAAAAAHGRAPRRLRGSALCWRVAFGRSGCMHAAPFYGRAHSLWSVSSALRVHVCMFATCNRPHPNVLRWRLQRHGLMEAVTLFLAVGDPSQIVHQVATTPKAHPDWIHAPGHAQCAPRSWASTSVRACVRMHACTCEIARLHAHPRVCFRNRTAKAESHSTGRLYVPHSCEPVATALVSTVRCMRCDPSR